MTDNSRIILITGSYPPNYCGVGDYTNKLLENLKLVETFDVLLFNRSDWSLKLYFKYLKDLINLKGDLYHFQYPTEGYGYSFLPLFLVCSFFQKKTIVTVHELSSRNRLAYIYTQILIFFSNMVFVTNTLEKKHASRFIFRKGKIRIVAIGCNIEKSKSSDVLFRDRSIDLGYFGHIRPFKGIEKYLQTVSLINNDNWNIKIIGQVLPKYSTFYEDVKRQTEKLNVEFVINKDELEVADLLANVKIIYLPFPDGISNRRGSLLAAIQNGCTIVSTKSEIKEFNDFFSNNCFLVDSDEQAAFVIEQLLTKKVFSKEQGTIKYWFSWQNVVSEHVTLYNELMNKKSK
jgi:glycosyltransferase involved in cell wall biosynthesis